MRGEMDFFGALQQRVKLLEGLAESRLNEICHNLPLMPGAKELVGELKNRGYMVAIFSGGFRNATRHFKDIVGYDAEGFIIKNSWGANWRYYGYERVSYDFHELFAYEALVFKRVGYKK